MQGQRSGSEERAGWEIESLFHFIVNATDFARSLDFYTTLGFRLLRDNRDVIWPAEVAENFGMPAAQGRGALLAIGGGLPFWGTLVAGVVWGSAGGMFNNSSRAVFQEEAPATHRARVLAVYSLGIFGGGAVGSPLAGVLAGQLGAELACPSQ